MYNGYLQRRNDFIIEAPLNLMLKMTFIPLNQRYFCASHTKLELENFSAFTLLISAYSG